MVVVPALAQECAGRYYSCGTRCKLGGEDMYNDLFDIGANNKEMAVGILVTVAVLVVVFGTGYLLGLRNAGADVSGNGGGNAGAGQQIEQAGTDIQNTTDGIKEAAGTAGAIGSTIKDAKDTAGYIHSTAADSATIISECQQILAGIRRRGKADQAAH